MLRARFRFTLCLLIALTAVRGAERRAAAAPAAEAAAPAGAAPLLAERARLRGQLDRVNAEIDAFKRAGRGVGDDYRLRARMADAEALARQLVAIDARLGLTAPAAAPRPLPVASPSDSPSDLEAKADILADQSRRIRAAADDLDRRLGEIKGRQELRRRAADLDRDPFAPLEGSKRRTMSVAAGSGAQDSSHGVSTPTIDRGPTGVAQTPTTGNLSVSGGASAPGAASTSSTVNLTPTGNPSPVTTTALPVELRELLDPATVADIGRLDRLRPAGNSMAALERAVAALRARAAAVDAQAQSMRRAAKQR
ncbi:MAG TPA: hypothetical protein VMT03_21060 [Polyangia bacterium]|nr:hypothetical protein [Polyangia bacterium]